MGYFQRDLYYQTSGEIEIALVDYSESKRVRLRPDIVEYGPGESIPLYDLIVGKENHARTRRRLGLQGEDHLDQRNPVADEKYNESAAQT